ncbi:MAG: hypothetical protein OEN01_14285 [Candidatus Krumholzibacteria bacterium]|nr:hypothetical protein [Candidatus Krumholzibacteria bacterium]
MKRHLKSVAVVFLVIMSVTPASGGSEQAAYQVLKQAAEAYQNATALRDTLHLTIWAPQAAPERKWIAYGFGKGGQAYVDNGFQRIVAIGEHMYVTQFDVADKYVEASYNGDFGAAIERIGADQMGIPELPPIAMHRAAGFETYIDAFRLKALQPLRVSRTVSSMTATAIQWTKWSSERRMANARRVSTEARTC